MAAIVRLGSVGIDLIVPLIDHDGNPVDLTLATDMTLFLTPPNSTVSSVKVARRYGSGKESKMVYRTVPGDLPMPGEWKAQARVQYVTPLRDWFSEIHPFIVASNLGPGVTRGEF